MLDLPYSCCKFKTKDSLSALRNVVVRRATLLSTVVGADIGAISSDYSESTLVNILCGFQ